MPVVLTVRFCSNTQ